jgi:ABC-type transport system involved in cytochrome c biogenesis permease subunit
MAAVAATMGVTALAVVATYLRFEWHLEEDGDIPWLEVMATLTLVAGGVVSAICIRIKRDAISFREAA